MGCFGPGRRERGTCRAVRPQVHFQVHLLGLKTQRRGRNAEGSTSDKWMGNILQMRKEAVPFLESLGIPKPRSKAEWSYIFKEMGTFLAAKNFIVNCPLPVMEIAVAPVHDSKEALRFRAVCNERITLSLASLKAFDSVYTKLVAGLSKSSMVEVKVNWRCNVVHDWVEQVPQEAAGALYDRLGYSSSGSWVAPPPWVPRAPKVLGGRHHAPHTRPGHQAIPAHQHGRGHGVRKETKHVFWALARWAGPMTPSGTRRWKGRRLRRCWMGYKLFIGYMRQLRRDLPLRVPLGPEKEVVKPSSGGWRKAHRRVKVLRKDWRFPGGRMVGEQGRHIRHGQCPILLGTPGSPSTPGPLRTFPSSGLELRLCG